MAKKKCDNAEIANFIENVEAGFGGQRNTLVFMKKLGNVDATEVIRSAAIKETNYVTERVRMLLKIEEREEDLSEEARAYARTFVEGLHATLEEDIEGIDVDLSELETLMASL